jgi:acetoin utilization protein AcuB
MIVSEIMTEEPITAQASDSIGEVLDVMAEHDIRHIPIVDGNRLVGFVSDRDLRSYAMPARVQFANPDRAAQRLEHGITEVMSGDVLSIGPEDEATELVRLMLDQRLGAVPVVNRADDELVGIVSYVDILRAVEDII